MPLDSGPAPELGSPRGVLYPRLAGKSMSMDQIEAARLALLRDVSTIKDAVVDGLAACHLAERDNDPQAMIAGLRKLLAAGLLAKDVADAMELPYAGRVSL